MIKTPHLSDKLKNRYLCGMNNDPIPHETKLFNANFLLICTASFLMFVSFYLLMPIITMYTIEELGATPSTAGYVVSSYIITALLMRPFSGFLVDRYDHRRFYIVTMALYTLLLGGYIISASVGALILTRVLLGACFALATTGSSTLIIDVLPPARRSEGIGYNGAFIILAMAVGPMLGLYLIDTFHYMGLFIMAIASSSIGFVLLLFVRTHPRPRVTSGLKLLSLDRFFLREATSICVVIALVYFLYGCYMVYVALLLKEQGEALSSSNFFLFFALGVLFSRIMTGKALNRGQNFPVLQGGMVCIIVGTLLFLYTLNTWSFPLIAIMLGIGFGVSGPATQTLIIDMVPHNRRGTANSTYFIALDLGSGIGMLLGGTIATLWDYPTIFLIGNTLTALSFVLLLLWAKGDYFAQKARLGAIVTP